MSVCHLHRLPDSVLCHVWAFLTASSPATLVASDGSFQPQPPSSRHQMLLSCFNRVCTQWRDLARDTEAWCDDSALLVSFFPQHPACSFLALLQPSFHWLRAHLHHLVLAVAVSDGVSASSARTQSFVNLLTAAPWPALRSLSVVGSDSTDFHSQIDLHAMWHALSQPTASTDADGATLLFPRLEHVMLRHGSAAPFLLNLRTSAALPCCSRSPFHLLAACPQLTSLTLQEVYCEQRVAQDLFSMPQLQRLRLYDIATDKEQWQQWLVSRLAQLPNLRSLSFGLKLPMRASQHPCRRLEIAHPLAALGMHNLLELELQGRWNCANAVVQVTQAASATVMQLQRLTLRWVFEGAAVPSLRAPASTSVDRMWDQFDAVLFAQTLSHLRHLSLLEIRAPDPVKSATQLLKLFQPVLAQLDTLQLDGARGRNMPSWPHRQQAHALLDTLTTEAAHRPALEFV